MAQIGARLAAARGWRGVAATWLAGAKWVAAPPLAGALLALGGGVRVGVSMRTRWHRSRRRRSPSRSCRSRSCSTSTRRFPRASR